MNGREDPAEAGRGRRTGIVLFLLTAVVYLASAGYDRVHIDVMSADVGAWRIASTGAPWLEGLDQSRINDTKVPMFVSPGADGHEVIARTPGVVAASVPAYLVRQWLTDAGTSAADFSYVPASVTAALLTALAVLLLWLALRMLVAPRVATAAAVVFAFATPVWSVAADGMWSHTVTVLGICGMAYAAARDRWLLVGLFGGVAVWGRLHTVLITAALALVCAALLRRPRIVVEVGAVGAVVTAAASAWSQWVHGTWIPTGGYQPSTYVDRQAGASNDFTEGPLGVLVNELGLWVAPDRGMLLWTPALLILLPLVVRSWREQATWTRALLLGGLAYTLLQGWLNAFHGGDGIFGYRHGLEFLACAAPALTVAATRAGAAARTLLTLACGVQLAAFTLGGLLNRPTLTFDEHWRNNAFLYAVTAAPVLLLLLAACVGATFLAARTYLRGQALDRPPEPSGAGATRAAA